MKTIFDTKTVGELVGRINSLQANSQAQWGKMDAYQMLKHCTLSEEMFQGKKQYERLFIGRLFGVMALKGILKNEDPMKKNQPTHPEMKITGTGNFDAEKAKWIELLQGYARFSNNKFIHPFFGKMTTEQIGNYVYKHTDHHLRQFGN
ncbi:DUF1569 domain-containing protein [Pedobacter agri]|uniref:DUF1569 domain-containing protein n=1 Tax=Pedobacter agri TaxID=454586 RepID=UPI00292FB6CB|nr:DUF1569 domain-containing protein [Pedobacter agri]